MTSEPQSSSFAEKQLELFDVTKAGRPAPRLQALGWLLVQLRYDQVVLVGIAGLIGMTVVFALGVERGKQLVRSERALLARTPEKAGNVRPGMEHPTATVSEPSGPPTTTSAPAITPKALTVPAQTPKKAPAKLAAKIPAVDSGRASGTSRYAIQVVTYRAAQTAKRELTRLQSSGEPAFLMIRDGYTAVLVGPFPSKAHARENATRLRSTYQDCFVKTL